MEKYLLDTNVLLRLTNSADPQHNQCRQAVEALKRRGARLCVVPQVLIEFWVVATRPIGQNGYGWNPDVARRQIDGLLELFDLFPDTRELLQRWLDLVTRARVCGKRAHDARLVALATQHAIDSVVTLNPGDFNGLGVIVIHPRELVASP